MNREEMTEALLSEICHMIDIMPTRVQEQRITYLRKVDEYYLRSQELQCFIYYMNDAK